MEKHLAFVPIETVFWDNDKVASLLLKSLRQLKETACKLHNQASVKH